MNKKMQSLYEALVFIEPTDLATMTKAEWFFFENAFQCCTPAHRNYREEIDGTPYAPKFADEIQP